MKRLAIIFVLVLFLSGCADLFYQPQRAKEWPDLGVHIAVVSVQEPKKEEEVVEEVSEEGEEPSEESTDGEQSEKSSADSGESEASSEDNAKPDEEAKE